MLLQEKFAKGTSHANSMYVILVFRDYPQKGLSDAYSTAQSEDWLPCSRGKRTFENPHRIDVRMALKLNRSDSTWNSGVQPTLNPIKQSLDPVSTQLETVRSSFSRSPPLHRQNVQLCFHIDLRNHTFIKQEQSHKSSSP